MSPFLKFGAIVFSASLLLASAAEFRFTGEAPTKTGEKPRPNAEEEKPKRSTYPYHGELARIDAQKRTLYLAGKKKERAIILGEKVRISRDGKPAKLSDAAPGERVSGSVTKDSEGREVAQTLNLKGSGKNAGGGKSK